MEAMTIPSLQRALSMDDILLSENTLQSFVGWSMAEQGLVTACLIVRNKRGKSRGFAYLELATKEAAEKVAEAINGCELNGRAIKVLHLLGTTCSSPDQVSPSDRPITSKAHPMEGVEPQPTMKEAQPAVEEANEQEQQQPPKTMMSNSDFRAWLLGGSS